MVEADVLLPLKITPELPTEQSYRPSRLGRHVSRYDDKGMNVPQ